MKTEKKHPEKRTQKGFSLLETIITMSLFFIILFGVYTMIIHYGDVSKTEHSRIRLHQESRYMSSAFAAELKEAGSTLTLLHTAGLLDDTPYFNGLLPLNSTTFPDGLIVATGDPEAVTSLKSDYTPPGTVLNVESATVPGYDPSYPNEIPEWSAGQKGIIVGKNGFYIFYVKEADPDANTITVRTEPVYYSGQLSISGSGNFSYDDDLGGSTTGNNITYTSKTPVIRLTTFSIYLFREKVLSGINRKIRELIRVTDTNGQANPLAEDSTAEVSVISENIYDMQISYITFDNFKSANRSSQPDHSYFIGGSTSTSVTDLMTEIRERRLKQINIDIVSITDQYGGRGKADLQVPALGDQASYSLPEGKYGFKLSSLSVEPRNFNIIL